MEWEDPRKMKQKHPKPAKCPPDDQWVVMLPIDLDAPHDMSWVGYHRSTVEARLAERFGPGYLKGTPTEGLLEWTRRARR